MSYNFNSKPLWLNKNERSVLNLLLEDSKKSDSEIARKIGISSQAVGFILKKLKNEEVIKNYTLGLNEELFGIKHAVIISFSLKSNVRKSEIETAEKFLIEEPHIISLFRILEGSKNHYISCTKFKDVEDFWEFVKNKFNKFFILEGAHHIPTKSILKLDLKPFYKHLINNHFCRNDKKQQF